MFTISRAALLKELSLLVKVIKAEQVISVLGYVLAEVSGDRLRLTASDLSVTATIELDVESDADERYCIPLKQLYALTRLFGDEEQIRLTRKDSRVDVRWGKSKHLLPLMEADKFLDTDRAEPSISFTLDGEWLRSSLVRVLPSITDEELRWSLNGVCVDVKDGVLHLVTTDGSRMSIVETPMTAPDTQVIVPESGARVIAALEGEQIELRLSENHLVAVAGSRQIISKLVSGKFPEWRMVVPAGHTHSAEVPAAPFALAIQRAKVTDASRAQFTQSMRLSFTHDSLTVSSKESDHGQGADVVEITSTLNGESVDIGIFPAQILSMLNGMDHLRCEFTDNNKQMLFTSPEVAGWRYVVAPVRLK